MNAIPPLRPPGLAPSAAAQLSAGRGLLPSVTLQAPLLDAVSARLALRCPEARLMEWILDGELEWAFDLRRAGSRRPCLRILTESVARLQQRGRPLTPREKAAQRSQPLPTVFDAMFQHHRPNLISTELARVWACCPNHIHNLIEDKLLTLLARKYVPREALQITRQSALHFMQTRRIL